MYQNLVNNLNSHLGIQPLKKATYLQPIFFIVFISLALRLIGIFKADLLVEEAYYWNYSTHLDIGYLDHPPMVALLIRLSCLVFGQGEFAVRFPALFCWLMTVFFSVKLSELIKKGSGIYSLMLLSILPFFFLQSMVITPDDPLLVCWSASLYFLYRLLVLDESRCWYKAGIALGLGLLSKYSIVLLGPCTLIFILLNPRSLKWLFKKELYLCTALSLLFFTPVIYWNATHDWASFIFQSSRRFQENYSFTFHQFMGLLILFLTPLGFLGLMRISYFKNLATPINVEAKSFLKIFTLTPLLFFAFFSLGHSIKFNWIGPSLLAFVSFLAIEMQVMSAKTKQYWLITIVILFISYAFMLIAIACGKPEVVNRTLFKKFIAWQQLATDLHLKAKEIEEKTGLTPIFMPLDLYNLNSELSYYQNKALAKGTINKSYAVFGRHLLAGNSLMYRYWSPETLQKGQNIILISNNPNDFIQNKFTPKSEINALWSYSQGAFTQIKPYYYQLVEMSS